MAIQQGDVRITKAVIPNGAKAVKRAKRGWVLAEGEHTGHAHVIEKENVEMFEKGGVLYLKNDVEATVVHEEHKPVTLPPGTWKIGIVREYDYFKDMTRKVVD